MMRKFTGVFVWAGIWIAGAVAVSCSGIGLGSPAGVARILAGFALFAVVVAFFNRRRLASVTLKHLLVLQTARLVLGCCALPTGDGAPGLAAMAPFVLDTAIAVFALAVVTRPVLRHRELLFAWNVVGSLELCLTVGVVARVGGGPILLGMLAAVLAPLLLVGHVLIAARLFRNQFWEQEPVRKPMPEIASAFLYTPALSRGGNA